MSDNTHGCGWTKPPQVVGRVYNDGHRAVAWLNSEGKKLSDNAPLYTTHDHPHAVFASLIAGALYDFAAFLTTREKSTAFGGAENASPMVELLKTWAKARGLPLDEAAVLSWSDALAAQKKEEPK